MHKQRVFKPKNGNKKKTTHGIVVEISLNYGLAPWQQQPSFDFDSFHNGFGEDDGMTYISLGKMKKKNNNFESGLLLFSV